MKEELQQFGVLYNSIDDPEIAQSEDRKKSLVGIAAISAGVAGAAVAMIPKNAKATGIADESYGVGVELGDDVNWIQKEGCPTAYTPGVGSSQLMHGYAPNRFKLDFGGFAYNKEDCGSYDAIVAKEFEIADGPNGGIIIKGLGKALAMDPAIVNNIIDGQSQDPWTLIEVDRGDGRTAKIKPYGNDKIFKDEENKWQKMPVDEYNPSGECYAVIDSVHPLANSQKIKIVGGTFWNTQTLDLFYSVWRVDISELDYCFAIQQSINSAWEKEGKDPYEAGLLNHIEDGNLAAPESDTLLLVTGNGGIYGAGTDFVKFDPKTQQYTHLQHNADGTYTPENPQKGEADFPGAGYPYKQNLFYPKALLKIETPSGRKIHLIANEGHKINFEGGFSDIRFFAVEELTDGNSEIYFKDVNITLEEQDQYPDDDGDNLVNHEDNCRWRANPEQVNSTADENGDACKADCTAGGWVGVDLAPLQTNSSGLRICQSELGFDFAFSFEDGSTIHSNMDVGVLNGKIELKPGQIVRYIHSWDPRTEKVPSPNISLPGGNSVKIKVLSAKNLDGIDGQTIFNHDGNSEYFNSASDWQDFGIVGSGEIENASDIEIEVGNENPLPVAETQAEPAQIVEAPQTAEIPSKVEIPAQVELPQNIVEEAGVVIAEQPNVAEIPNVIEQSNVAEIPAVAESILDVFYGNPEPDAITETAEKTAEPAPDIIQPLDSQPDSVSQETTTDTVQSSDFSNPDTVLLPTDTPADTQSDSPPQIDSELDQDSASDSETLSNPDTAIETSNFDTFQQADSAPDSETAPDAQNIPQKDTILSTDISKPAEEKGKGGDSGGGCSLAFVLDKSGELPYQNPNIDGANLLITATVLARLYGWTRRKIARV